MLICTPVVVNILPATTITALQNQNKHLGYSHATELEIKNDTTQAIQIKVSHVDSHDWDGLSRPDFQFQNVTIEAGASKKALQNIKARRSTAVSTITVYQDGKEQFAIRINQWDAMADEMETKDVDLDNNYVLHLTGGKRMLTISIAIKQDS
ncbi:unnamed protein product [Adineta steineri]|uniref:Uncharacterized protein n=1 Tax=Adineta steineri TaxID=433720 RepID=A0A820AW86_9BILA|nr:unnamed protein product [Adineta steineri]CAF4183505.1 unnamed protein product [Adineta steineri]